MKTTILDDYIGTCLANKDKLHICGAMDRVLKANPPVAHLWETSDALQVGLPPAPIVWPDSIMCLCVAPGVVPGYHKFCIDQGLDVPMIGDWIEQSLWSLNGLLVYPFDERTFDVIPLAKQISGSSTVMPEVQLHFVWNGDAWVWQKASTGQVNAYFHNVIIRTLTDQEAVEDSIAHLGEVVQLCLGTYLKHINQPGKWAVQLPKEPKLKLKDGKVKKVYRPGTVGYKQFVVTGATHE